MPSVVSLDHIMKWHWSVFQTGYYRDMPGYFEICNLPLFTINSLSHTFDEKFEYGYGSLFGYGMRAVDVNTFVDHKA